RLEVDRNGTLLFWSSLYGDICHGDAASSTPGAGKRPQSALKITPWSAVAAAMPATMAANPSASAGVLRRAVLRCRPASRHKEGGAKQKRQNFLHFPAVNHHGTPSAQGCHPCLRYALLAPSPVRPGEAWWSHQTRTSDNNDGARTFADTRPMQALHPRIAKFTRKTTTAEAPAP